MGNQRPGRVYDQNNFIKPVQIQLRRKTVTHLCDKIKLIFGETHSDEKQSHSSIKLQFTKQEPDDSTVKEESVLKKWAEDNSQPMFRHHNDHESEDNHRPTTDLGNHPKQTVSRSVHKTESVLQLQSRIHDMQIEISQLSQKMTENQFASVTHSPVKREVNNVADQGKYLQHRLRHRSQYFRLKGCDVSPTVQ